MMVSHKCCQVCGARLQPSGGGGVPSVPRFHCASPMRQPVSLTLDIVSCVVMPSVHAMEQEVVVTVVASVSIWRVWEGMQVRTQVVPARYDVLSLLALYCLPCGNCFWLDAGQTFAVLAPFCGLDVQVAWVWTP